VLIGRVLQRLLTWLIIEKELILVVLYIRGTIGIESLGAGQMIKVENVV
jgi:hypothetical protein